MRCCLREYKTKLSFLVILLYLLPTGCSCPPTISPTSTTRNIKIVKIVEPVAFDFHILLEDQKGGQQEFYVCEYTSAFIANEGKTVTIEFYGNGTSMEDCAKNVIVTPMKGNDLPPAPSSMHKWTDKKPTIVQSWKDADIY